MDSRDCNTCAFHDQGALLAHQPYPPRCSACLESKSFLPFWSPMTKTILDKQVVDKFDRTFTGAAIAKRTPEEDFRACGAVREDPRAGKMVGPFNFPKDPAMRGIGGAPTRATTLPEAAAERKKFPVASGVLDYFPDAIVAIAQLSYKGNEQHNPGQPLNWSRGKSNDHADTMLRHFLQRGTVDDDGVRHSVKMAWRALALLQCEIEAEKQ